MIRSGKGIKLGVVEPHLLKGECVNRYDYDPRYSRLSVRMPSPLHETLCAEIVWEISNQLKVLQKGSGPEAVFAKQIKNLGSSRIDLPQESMDGERRFSRREPDASFGHCQARYPGVVVEVCYSQKSREIYRLADDYILSSDGSINAVVCINVEYKASKKATFSVWRPTYHTKDGAVEFRSTCVVKEQVSLSIWIYSRGEALRSSLIRRFSEQMMASHQVRHHYGSRLRTSELKS